MRQVLWLVVLGLMMSGCASDDGKDPGVPVTGNGDPRDSNGDGIPDTGVDADGDGTPDPIPIPEPIVFSGSLRGIGDVTANSPVPCPLGAEQCVDHVVSIPAGPWNVTFTLVGTDGTVTSQGVPYGTDYDLFVEGVGESTNPSGEADVVTKRLDAGDVTAQVLAWHDIDGEYTLTVSFAY